VTLFTTYLRYEALRTLRNRRFMILALGFPLVIYFLIATPNRHETNLGGTGISAPLYLMVGLVTFGTMNAMLGSGARIAAERSAGWNRQLRITPLKPTTYFRTKVLTGYMLAAMTMVLLYVAGSALGVSLTVSEWVRMTLLLLVGLIPFAALGILFGHLLTPDSIGPAIGGLTAALSILGGVWFPVTGHGILHDVALGLPSYWLVQAAHIGVGGSGWDATGWIVFAAWTIVAAFLARRAYERDTKRT
jgi:ABC-2 type transport system permease protein